MLCHFAHSSAISPFARSVSLTHAIFAWFLALITRSHSPRKFWKAACTVEFVCSFSRSRRYLSGLFWSYWLSVTPTTKYSPEGKEKWRLLEFEKEKHESKATGAKYCSEAREEWRLYWLIKARRSFDKRQKINKSEKVSGSDWYWGKRKTSVDRVNGKDKLVYRKEN